MVDRRVVLLRGTFGVLALQFLLTRGCKLCDALLAVPVRRAGAAGALGGIHACSRCAMRLFQR